MDKPKQHTIEERIKVLEACKKRWHEVGETECAAIYQGAAFELNLMRERVAQLEGFKVVLDGICDIVNTNENISVAVQRLKDERDQLRTELEKAAACAALTPSPRIKSGEDWSRD